MASQKKKGDSARDRVLKTASKLFYANGIKSTGIDTIIAQSDVAKMTFYHHFPSKQKLIMEYLKTRGEEWFAWLIQKVEENPVEKRPLALFDAVEEWVSQKDFRGCFFINAAVEAGNFDAEEHRFAFQNKLAVLSYIEKLLKEAGYKSSKVLAEEFFLLVDGVIVRTHMDGNAKYAQVAKTIANTLLKGQK